MKQRVLTATLLIPFVLAAIFMASFWPLWIAALAVFLIGYTELRHMTGSKWRIPVVGMFPVLLGAPAISSSIRDLPLLTFAPSAFDAAFWLTIATALGVIGCIYVTQRGRGFLATETASLWVACPLSALIVLKLLEGESGTLFNWKTPLLLAFIPLWIGDSAGYFFGKAWGKRLLAPTISPKKTWVGAFANLLGCILGAVALSYLIDVPLFAGMLVGLVTGVLGQAGDLLESAMKRASGIKDSGNLLPGHGGILDRIDSMLLTAPMTALILCAFVVPPR